MLRLSEPQYSFEQTLDECAKGISGNIVLRNNLVSSKMDLTEVEAQYLLAAGTGKLFSIPPIHSEENADPIVIDSLTKTDLVKIYDRYFVSKQKPARKIYDSLLNAAKEKCPFCGGIGTPRNLDHFLPKSHFPQFSVLPRNLVPSCRDCNMEGKGHAFATKEHDQIIQPYADNDRFFLDQWIFATYHPGIDREPGEFEYYIKPPEKWSDVDRQRVGKHFKDFNLAKRYAIKAAEHFGTVLNQITTMRQNNFDNEIIQEVILQPGVDSAPFVNHWQNGMYQALMQAFIN